MGSRSGSPRSRRSGSRSRSRSRSGSPRSRGSGSRSRSRSPLGSDDESPSKKTKKRRVIESDGSDLEDDTNKELIADIFGSSDEEEEFEGFGAVDIEASQK